MDEHTQPRTRMGGRQAGTPNKATANVKAFLAKVFDRAFADPGFETELVLQITTLKIDTKLLCRLLEYYAGAPAKAIDVKGKLTLEQIVAGAVADAVDEAEDEAAAA